MPDIFKRYFKRFYNIDVFGDKTFELRNGNVVNFFYKESEYLTKIENKNIFFYKVESDDWVIYILLIEEENQLVSTEITFLAEETWEKEPIYHVNYLTKGPFFRNRDDYEKDIRLQKIIGNNIYNHFINLFLEEEKMKLKNSIYKKFKPA